MNQEVKLEVVVESYAQKLSQVQHESIVKDAIIRQLQAQIEELTKPKE
jgi:hypothetical protein